MAQGYEKSFNHPVYYLFARNSENQIRGVLPLVHLKSLLFGNFLTSLPFFNYGGLSNREDEVSAALLHKAGKLLVETGADHLELRHLGGFENGLITKQHKVTMILDLEQDEEEQWRALDAKVRNQVRKAKSADCRQYRGTWTCWMGFMKFFAEI